MNDIERARLNRDVNGWLRKAIIEARTPRELQEAVRALPPDDRVDFLRQLHALWIAGKLTSESHSRIVREVGRV